MGGLVVLYSFLLVYCGCCFVFRLLVLGLGLLVWVLPLVVLLTEVWVSCGWGGVAFAICLVGSVVLA